VSLAQAQSLTVHLEVVNAAEVTLANAPSFASGKIVLSMDGDEKLTCTDEEREGVTWQVCDYTGWNLLAGVWDDSSDSSAPDGEYTLFARFLDRNGYESDVYKAKVTVDATAPAVAVAELSRSIAMTGQPVLLTVTFLEAVNDDDGKLLLAVAPDPGPALTVEGPVRFENSNTYFWTLTAVAGELSGVVSYAFEIDAVDLVGNGLGMQNVAGQNQEGLLFTVDPNPPALVFPVSEQEVEYETGFGPSMDSTLAFGFVLKEEVALTLPGAELPCDEYCPQVRVGTSVAGLVTRVPLEDAPEEHTLAFHFTHEMSAETYAELDKEMELAVLWQDAAGNQMEAPLPLPVHVDFRGPLANLCQLSPQSGNSGTVFTYSLTASEPLAELPTLQLAPDAGYFKVGEASKDMQTFTWTQAAEEMEPGEFTLSALLEDVAGNVSSPLCEKFGTLDPNPPTIEHLSVTTDPAVVDSDGVKYLVAGPGAEFRATVTVKDDVALAEEPLQITLNAAGQQLAFEEEETTQEEDGALTVSLVLTVPDDPAPQLEGYWPMLIKVFDAAGNETSVSDIANLDEPLAGSSVHFDFTPPGAECSLIPQPGLGGYGENQTVVLKVVPLELLEEDYSPVVSEDFTPGLGAPFLDGSGDFIPPADAGPDSNIWYFSGEVTPDLGVQSFAFGVSLKDRAGNETAPGDSACSSALTGTMDPIAPAAVGAEVTVSPAVVSLTGEELLRMGPLHSLHVSLTVEENQALSAELPFLLLDIPGNPIELDLTQAPEPDAVPQVYEYTLAAAEALLPTDEGTWPLKPVIADAAGNTYDQQLDGQLVTVDFSPPQAECMLIPAPEESAYPLGQKVTLQVLAFEETILVPEPTAEVEFDPPLANPFFAWEEESRFRFSGIVAESLGSDPAETMGERTFAIKRVALTDLVGNKTPEGHSACGDVALSGQVDALTPSVVSLAVAAEGPNGAIEIPQTPVGPGAELKVTLTVQGTALEPEVTVASAPLTATEDSPVQMDEGLEWVFVRSLTGDEQTGVADLQILGKDEAGNPYGKTLDDVAMLDFSPPGVLNASLLLTPPPWAKIQWVTRVTNGTGIKLVLTASEALMEPPVLSLERGGLVRELADGLKVGGELSTTYQYLVDEAGGFSDAPAEQGVWQVEASLIDLAGNDWNGPLALSQDFVVDAAAPEALDSGEMNAIRLYRNPWGSEETGYVPLIEVRGCGDPETGVPGFDWCPAEGLARPSADSHIALYQSTVVDGEVACTASALAVGSGEIGDNAWSVAMLTDLPVVCLSQIDQAGNESDPSPIELVEWVGTLNGKVAGGTTANPNKLIEVISQDGEVMPRLGNEAVEVQKQAEIDGAMQLGDGQVATNRLRAGWKRFSSTGIEPPDVEGIVPLVFDSWRGRPLQVGGSALSTLLGWYEDDPGSQTWEFDGRNWTRRMPPVEPPRRAGHAMAWDAVRGRLVMFGGNTTTNNVLGDTWEYDGSAWHVIGSDQSPEPRLEAAMTFNAMTGKVMLFGGHEEPINMTPSWSDTWEYGADGWSELSAEQAGLRVVYPHLVYHEKMGAVLLTGWAEPVDFNQPPDMSIGIWQWTGEEWEKLPGDGAPEVPGEDGWSVAYDSIRESVLFAIPSLTGSADVYQWKEGVWTHFQTSGVGAHGWHRGGLCHDPYRELTLFLGFADHDGLAGTPPVGEWSGGSPAFYPVHPSGPFMGYDGAFICPQGPDGCQYRTYIPGYNYYRFHTLASNDTGGVGWVESAYDNYPSNASYAVFGYDGISGELLSTTMGLYSTDATTLQLVNGTSWQQVDKDPGPCQNYSKYGPYFSAWDPVRQLWLTHASGTLWQWDGEEWSGLVLPGDPGVAASGTWDDYLDAAVIPGHPAGTFIWDGFNWTRLADGPGAGKTPALALRTATAYDEARGLLVHMRQNSDGLAAVYEFDGDEWTEVALAGSFEWGKGAFASYWAQETATVALAGTEATGVDDNDRLKTWFYAPAESKPHFVVGFDVAASATILPSPLDPTPARPVSYTLRVAAGAVSHTMGSGQLDGERTPGVEYHVFSTNPQPWMPVGSIRSAGTVPRSWSASFQSDWRCQGTPYCAAGGPDRWIAPDGFLYLDVAPINGWGASPREPKLDLDYVELRIVYRRAAEGEPAPACQPDSSRCSGGVFQECLLLDGDEETWGFQDVDICDDDSPCTLDTCDPVTGCQHDVVEVDCAPGQAICMGRKVRPCQDVYADDEGMGACWLPDEPEECPENQWCVEDEDGAGCRCKYNSCGDNCCPQNPTGLEYVCHNDECCLPSCEAGQCGSDGCGGTCPCEEGEECATGVCQCLPEACGPNCGDCTTGQVCVEGTCLEPLCEEGMCMVPAGEFIMGWDVTSDQLCVYDKLRQDWYADALHAHKVYLDAFEIDEREVTHHEYSLCVDAGVCTLRNTQQPTFGDDHPVRGVTWDQADAYCSWVGKRLCTAAEHEKAARGTDGRKYPWGNSHATSAQAVTDTFKTEPAGNKPAGASPFGVLGLVDNGVEWVADVYDPYYYFYSPTENPTGPEPYEGCEREGRGSGGDNYSVAYLPAFHRQHDEPGWDWWYSVRCCRSPD